MNLYRNALSRALIAIAVVLIVIVVGGATYFAFYQGKGTTTTSAAYYSATIQAGGSTFVNPVMQSWAVNFTHYTGGAVGINYVAGGSAAGITGVLKGIFEFAGSDAPVDLTTIANYTAAKGPFLQFPETLGGVAIFYNIAGVTQSLNLTGPVIARIYLGNITKWNDPAIQQLNPGVSLPSATIVPVHRSDGSGTTYALTNYFEKVSTDWNASFENGQIASTGCPCYGTLIGWPSFELGAKGSGGVAATVKTTPNSIGYADSYYAFTNHLEAAAIKNQAGQFLTPSLENIAAAASAFSAEVQANPTFSITNAPGSGSYPIATFTYLLVWQNQANHDVGFDIAHFFWWVVNQGQTLGPPLNYPALPSNLVSIDQSIIQKINYNGVSFIS